MEMMKMMKMKMKPQKPDVSFPRASAEAHQANTSSGVVTE
jgi:hypothetical protein